MSEPIKWTWKYHNKHTEVMSSEDYARKLDQVLSETRAMYPFQGDSTDYHLIRDAAVAVCNVPGLFCEIGFRAGAGIRFMVEGIHQSPRKTKRTLIAIDPYGAIPYEGYEGEVTTNTPYSNLMMKQTLELMYRYVACHDNLHFLFFPMEDFEFFKRFADGVPVYVDGEKQIVNQYALVHFDGPHTVPIVMNEVEFFQDKTPVGAMYIFDDISHFYDHDKIEEYIFERGWMLVEKTSGKASYIKTS